VNEVLVSNSEVYKVYRGFKPSGLNKGGAGALVTQMPGKIVKIMKKEGDKVSKGETVLILEAMKMENEIKSGADGTVKSVNVKEGQALEAGFLMVEIEE
jgi:biotin carboxyl carrier protein